jgi:carbon storage regulator
MEFPPYIRGKEVSRMLVLTRRPGQAIKIGDDIEIYIVEVRGDQVRLSIEAPREVAILRREVLDDIHRANKEAADADVDALEALTNLASACAPSSKEAPQLPAKKTPKNFKKPLKSLAAPVE